MKNHLELSKFSKIRKTKEIFGRICHKNEASSEEYIFKIIHVTQGLTAFWVKSPNNLVLPGALNELRVGLTMEFRVLTEGERRSLQALKILNNPISWWMTQSGFKTLLAILKLKPMTPMPIPNDDRIDKFFNVDQRRAIAAAFDEKRPFVVVHGPRGSGKTLVAAEIINKVCEEKNTFSGGVLVHNLSFSNLKSAAEF